MNNNQEESAIEKSTNKLNVCYIVILPILFVSLAVILFLVYVRRFQQKPTSHEAQETAQTAQTTASVEINEAIPSMEDVEKDFVKIEIPIKYWAHDTEPAIVLSVYAPKSSELISEDEGTRVKLFFPDESFLGFGIAHVGDPQKYDEDKITPIETNNYENIVRVIKDGKAYYSDLEIGQPCSDLSGGELQSPCGSYYLFYIINSCEDPTEKYIYCDEVIRTIDGIKPAIRFNLDQVRVSSTITPSTLHFYSETYTNFTQTKTSDISIELDSKKVTIYVEMGQGETGGWYDYIPNYELVNNPNIERSIARVQSSNNSQLRFNKSIDQEDMQKTIYFYTTTYGNNVECVNETPDSVICSSNEIKYDDQYFGVYCIPREKKDVSYCDEFVKNLTFYIK